MSPHIDDDALSIGGHLSKWAGAGEFVRVLYVFSSESWTNPAAIEVLDDSPTQDVIELRKKEALAASSLNGHDVEFLDFLRTERRGGRRGLRRRLAAVRAARNQRRLADAISRDLALRFEGATEVYLPLACGDWVHPEHLLLRTIGTQLVGAAPRTYFYEDLPYAARRGPEDAVPVYLLSKLEPVESEIDIDRKLELVRCFASQVSERWIDEVVSHSYHLGRDRPVERLWAYRSA